MPFADATGVKKKSTFVTGKLNSHAILEPGLVASLCRCVVDVFTLNLQQQVPNPYGRSEALSPCQ